MSDTMYDSYHRNCAGVPQHPLPPQSSRLTSHHHHGPAAEDLLVPEERVLQGCTAHHGLCQYQLGNLQFVPVGKRSQSSFWWTWLSPLWWPLNTLFQTGKGAMGSTDFSMSLLLFPRCCTTFNSVFQPFVLTALCHAIVLCVRCNCIYKRIP